MRFKNINKRLHQKASLNEEGAGKKGRNFQASKMAISPDHPRGGSFLKYYKSCRIREIVTEYILSFIKIGRWVSELWGSKIAICH